MSETSTPKRKKQLSREAMYNTIRAPLITEKATLLSEKGQIVFRVSIDATNPGRPGKARRIESAAARDTPRWNLTSASSG